MGCVRLPACIARLVLSCNCMHLLMAGGLKSRLTAGSAGRGLFFDFSAGLVGGMRLWQCTLIASVPVLVRCRLGCVRPGAMSIAPFAGGLIWFAVDVVVGGIGAYSRSSISWGPKLPVLLMITDSELGTIRAAGFNGLGKLNAADVTVRATGE